MDKTITGWEYVKPIGEKGWRRVEMPIETWEELRALVEDQTGDPETILGDLGRAYDAGMPITVTKYPAGSFPGFSREHIQVETGPVAKPWEAVRVSLPSNLLTHP